MSRLRLILGGRLGSSPLPTIDIEETYPASSKLGQGGITETRSITSQKNALGVDTDHFVSDGSVIKITATGVAASLGMGPYILTLSDGKKMRITTISGAGVRSAAEFATWTATDAPSIAALKAVQDLWWRDVTVDPGIAGNFGNPLRRGNYNDGSGEPSVRIRSIYGLTDPTRCVKFSTTVKWNFQGIEWWDIAHDPTSNTAMFEINGDNSSWPAGHIHIYGMQANYPELPWQYSDDAIYEASGEGAFTNASAITGSGTNIGRIRIGSSSSYYAKEFCRYLGTNHPDGVVLTNIVINRYWAIPIQFSVNSTNTVVPWEIRGISISDGIARVLDYPPPPNNPHPDAILASGRNTFAGKQTILIYDYHFWQTPNCRGDVGPYWACRDMVTGTVGAGGTTAGGAFVPDFRRWRCMGSKGGIMFDHQNADTAYFDDLIISSRGLDGDPIGVMVCGGTGPGQSTYGTHTISNCYSEGYQIGGTPTLTNNITVSNNTTAAWQAHFPNINFAPVDEADLVYQLTAA